MNKSDFSYRLLFIDFFSIPPHMTLSNQLLALQIPKSPFCQFLPAKTSGICQMGFAYASYSIQYGQAYWYRLIFRYLILTLYLYTYRLSIYAFLRTEYSSRKAFPTSLPLASATNSDDIVTHQETDLQFLMMSIFHLITI